MNIYSVKGTFVTYVIVCFSREELRTFIGDSQQDNSAMEVAAHLNRQSHLNTQWRLSTAHLRVLPRAHGHRNTHPPRLSRYHPALTPTPASTASLMC